MREMVFLFKSMDVNAHVMKSWPWIVQWVGSEFDVADYRNMYSSSWVREILGVKGSSAVGIINEA